MGVFEPPEVFVFPTEASRRLEDQFIQKPTRLPLEVPLQPVFAQPQPRNDLPILIIGSLTLIGLVGLFLAYFLTSRRS